VVYLFAHFISSKQLSFDVSKSNVTLPPIQE
jgi:hypothetical protein